MRKLTPTQKELLEKLNLYKYVKNTTGSFERDHIKALCEFKTFDSTFNALFNKGYLKRDSTDINKNKFILS
tara:strand:+ start:9417 stop:9629 length:213 start_codon:yes stop_codon:yes gene_type:complete